MKPYLLTLMTVVPAGVGVLLAAVRSERGVKVGSLLASLVVLGLAGWMCVGFDIDALDARTGLDPAYSLSVPWISSLRINYATGVDGVSLSMILLTALLCPLCLLCSWEGIRDRVRGFFIAFLFLEAGMIGVFAATDLFLFYVFWEAMLIPMVLIIGMWGGKRRVAAAVKFFIYTMVGSLFMLLAILVVVVRAGTFDVFELQERLPGLLSIRWQVWLFLGFALAFAVKVPLFPLHTWLPDAHVEAPTAGSVILAGVLLKMGVYGFIRFAMPFFPEATLRLAPWVMALSLMGIVFGALMSMAQSDIKKLIAYSSVSHLGFCMLGLFSFTVVGAQGSVVQMVNHGISTGALFLLVGIVYERTHRRGVDDFGGLAKVMPIYAAVFLIVTLSSIGLPGLNGFVGEFLVLAGVFQGHAFQAAVAGTAVILGATYMLGLYRNVFFGPVTAAKNEGLPDLNRVEWASLVPLVVLIVVLGLGPSLITDRTEFAVKRIVGPFSKSVTYHGER